jgi:hypothetical protein
MGVTGPRSPRSVMDVERDGQNIRAMLELIGDSVLVTTRGSQMLVPLNGLSPKEAATEALQEMLKAKVFTQHPRTT